mmetsp:Transcript_83063/g.243547  ORF Transcript_83063/g.243547 Transcript_83063/m.243547 type:complete len:96 (+) Transcript_83063:521-808(+)
MTQCHGGKLSGVRLHMSQQWRSASRRRRRVDARGGKSEQKHPKAVGHSALHLGLIGRLAPINYLCRTLCQGHNMMILLFHASVASHCCVRNRSTS